jgi:hypothetical protein
LFKKFLGLHNEMIRALRLSLLAILVLSAAVSVIAHDPVQGSEFVQSDEPNIPEHKPDVEFQDSLPDISSSDFETLKRFESVFAMHTFFGANNCLRHVIFVRVVVRN